MSTSEVQATDWKGSWRSKAPPGSRSHQQLNTDLHHSQDRSGGGAVTIVGLPMKWGVVLENLLSYYVDANVVALLLSLWRPLLLMKQSRWKGEKQKATDILEDVAGLAAAKANENDSLMNPKKTPLGGGDLKKFWRNAPPDMSSLPWQWFMREMVETDHRDVVHLMLSAPINFNPGLHVVTGSSAGVWNLLELACDNDPETPQLVKLVVSNNNRWFTSELGDGARVFPKALNFASRNGSVSTIKTLLRTTDQVVPADSLSAALGNAVQGDHLKAAKALVQLGAVPKRVFLTMAMYGNPSPALVQYLCTHGLELNSTVAEREEAARQHKNDEMLPLHYVASKTNYADLLQTLLECGADPFIKYNGDTVFDIVNRRASTGVCGQEAGRGEPQGLLRMVEMLSACYPVPG